MSMEYDSQVIKSVLGNGGLLSKHLPNYTERTSQIELSEAIYQSYKDGTNLLAEAPTGIGKSIAGLVPAIIMAAVNHHRTVISTSTKALQSQYFDKDLPFLKKLFASAGMNFTYAMMKGKSNYLCTRRFNEFEVTPDMPYQKQLQYAQLSEWAKTTKQGDFEELPFEVMPELKSEVCCSEDDCAGRKCKAFCFHKAMKARAKVSDIVLVNTDLLCLDIITRNKFGADIIPDYHSVIIDEAHELEDIYSKYCGFNISVYAVKSLVKFVVKTIGKLRDAVTEQSESLDGYIEDVNTCAVKLMKTAKSFFDNFDFDIPASASITITHDDFDIVANIGGKKLIACLDKLMNCVERVSYFSSDEIIDEMFSRVMARTFSVRERLTQLMGLFDSDDDRFVYWVEQSTLPSGKKFVVVECRPVVITDELRERIFTRALSGADWESLFEHQAKLDTEESKPLSVKNVVLMSATMTTNGSFAFIQNRLGIDECTKIVLPHAFDYRHNALLYVPRGLVEPNISSSSDVFTRQLSQNIVELSGITDGKMLCLFTSYSEMNKVFGIVSPQIGQKYRLFRQGQYPKSELIRMFSADTDSILFATSSFWTGVDFQGDTLSALVIDRIPFPVPTDPLINARVNRIKADGGDWFNEYYIPMATMSMCQGFGRLIRTSTDMGIVMICDVRIVKKSYGSKFIRSFPPTLQTRKIEKVRLFYDIVKERRKRNCSTKQ